MKKSYKAKVFGKVNISLKLELDDFLLLGLQQRCNAGNHLLQTFRYSLMVSPWQTVTSHHVPVTRSSQVRKPKMTAAFTQHAQFNVDTVHLVQKLLSTGFKLNW